MYNMDAFLMQEYCYFLQNQQNKLILSLDLKGLKGDFKVA